MTKIAKFVAIAFLILLTSTILLAAVCAQDETPTPEATPFPEETIPFPVPTITPPPGGAAVIVEAGQGGITTPSPGTHYYDNGTRVTITASAYKGFKFQYWLVTGFYTADVYSPPIYIVPDEQGNLPAPTNDTYIATVPVNVNLVAVQNPFTFDCGYGYVFTYTAVFTPVTISASNAVVMVVNSVGGTTSPVAGTYTFSSGRSLTITATPADGFEFLYWVVSGSYFPGHGTGQTSLDSNIVKTNPLDITCGVGYTYTYQPVFTPTGSNVSGGGISAETFYIVVAVLAIIAVIAVLLTLNMYMKRGKK